MDKSKAHPGFDAVADRIARKTNPATGRPYGQERARAILASASRRTSASGAANPRLKKVGGG